MKKILTVILSLLVFISCSQTNSKKNNMNCTELKEKRGVWYYSNKPYTGTCQSQYKNGNIQSESSFKNGLIHGILKMYYDSGKLEETTEYLKGIPNGKVMYYFKNENVSEEGLVENGNKTGEWKSYYENGQLKSKENYKNGMLHGKVSSYTVKGKIELEGYFENNLQEGIWTFYNIETGKIDGKMEYRKGSPVNE